MRQTPDGGNTGKPKCALTNSTIPVEMLEPVMAALIRDGKQEEAQEVFKRVFALEPKTYEGIIAIFQEYVDLEYEQRPF